MKVLTVAIAALLLSAASLRAGDDEDAFKTKLRGCQTVDCKRQALATYLDLKLELTELREVAPNARGFHEASIGASRAWLDVNHPALKIPGWETMSDAERSAFMSKLWGTKK